MDWMPKTNADRGRLRVVGGRRDMGHVHRIVIRLGLVYQISACQVNRHRGAGQPRPRRRCSSNAVLCEITVRGRCRGNLTQGSRQIPAYQAWV